MKKLVILAILGIAFGSTRLFAQQDVYSVQDSLVKNNNGGAPRHTVMDSISFYPPIMTAMAPHQWIPGKGILLMAYAPIRRKINDSTNDTTYEVLPNTNEIKALVKTEHAGIVKNVLRTYPGVDYKDTACLYIISMDMRTLRTNFIGETAKIQADRGNWVSNTPTDGYEYFLYKKFIRLYLDMHSTGRLLTTGKPQAFWRFVPLKKEQLASN